MSNRMIREESAMMAIRALNKENGRLLREIKILRRIVTLAELTGWINKAEIEKLLIEYRAEINRQISEDE